MASSIESLAENIKKECVDSNKLKACFPNLSEHFSDIEKLDLMTQKGIYPYEYVNDYSKLLQTKLPPIDRFYSKLNKERCDKKDYERALKVWNKF
jgi:hypothetical protein